MTQMNAVTSVVTSSTCSPQSFSQTSSTAGSELTSPEGNDSSSGSEQQRVRDREHLCFREADLKNSSTPNFLASLKPRKNFGPNLFEQQQQSSQNATSVVAPTSNASNNNNNVINGKNGLSVNNNNNIDNILSPLLQRTLNELLMSPANRRSNLSLSSSLAAQSAFNNLHKNHPTFSIAETPTPTKILYPSQVTQEAKEFAEGFQKELEKIQAENQFSAANLASPSTNLLLPLISAALTPTKPPQNPLVPTTQQSANAATLNAIIAALTPVLTPTQTQTQDFFAAALATLTGTPTTPTASNFPSQNLLNNNQQQNPLTAVATGDSTATAVVASSTSLPSTTSSSTTIATTTTPSQQSLSEIYKNLDSGLMDHMFSNHADLNFPGLMSHFNQSNNGMGQQPQLPPHSQPLQTHNGYHQPGLGGAHQGPQQQPGMCAIKTEPGYGNNNSNGIGHSLQGSAATGMCQPPPQNLIPSTSSHQMAAYQSHLSTQNNGGLQDLEMNEQERRKLERKRARNRMAASKCRLRKIERIQQLEGEVQQERQRFQSLQNSLSSMEKTIAMLQAELQRHRNSGCSIDKSTINLMSHLSTIMNNNVSIPMDTR